MGSTIKMYGGGSGGSQDAIASIDVPQNGRLLGVYWSVDHDMDADGEFLRCQVSFGSASTFTTNDSRQVISECRAQAALTTSGVYNNALNSYHEKDTPVSAGERIYLHLSASSGLVSAVSAFLEFDFDQDRPATRRR